MRKLVAVGLVAFTTTVFGIAGLTQPRRPARPRRPTAARVAEVPPSPRIAQELGQVRWGMNHQQVVEYFAQQIRARYLPRMKNLGQIEQYRLTEQRENEIRAVQRSFMEFDGAPDHRRWDTSFIGEEYTHSNHEAMLLYEDARGNREFFFFINDRLWKRLQARNTAGAQINLVDFADQLEAIFGPGERVMEGARLRTVRWHDDTTGMHVIDATTFYNAFCLVYEDTATVAQLATLRTNVPTKNTRVVVQADRSQPEVGHTTGDANADIVDRITGHIRRVQNADGGVAGPAGTTTTGVAAANGTRRADAGAPSNSTVEDPLSGLGF